MTKSKGATPHLSELLVSVGVVGGDGGVAFEDGGSALPRGS